MKLKSRYWWDLSARDFAALDMDAAASADERAERALWDRTAQDGLADEPSIKPSRR